MSFAWHRLYPEVVGLTGDELRAFDEQKHEWSESLLLGDEWPESVLLLVEQWQHAAWGFSWPDPRR